MAEKSDKSEKSRVSQRDMTLINILERMADQIQKQDSRLEDIATRQGEYTREVRNAEYSRSIRQTDSDSSLTGLADALSRYRSDMLSLVNEQDHVNKNMAELQKLVNKAAYSVEVNNEKVAALDELVKSQVKEVHEHNELWFKQSEKVKAMEELQKSQVKEARDHYEHVLKQAESFPREIAAINRHITLLHTDTEKHLGKLHIETARQIEKLQSDTLRRLLILDNFEDALQTLLIRTEPPEKKVPWVVRLYYRISGFFRFKVPIFFKKVRLFLKNDDPEH